MSTPCRQLHVYFEAHAYLLLVDEHFPATVNLQAHSHGDVSSRPLLESDAGDVATHDPNFEVYRGRPCRDSDNEALLPSEEV